MRGELNIETSQFFPHPSGDWMMRDGVPHWEPITLVTETPSGLNVWKRTDESGNTQYLGESCGIVAGIYNTADGLEELEIVARDMKLFDGMFRIKPLEWKKREWGWIAEAPLNGAYLYYNHDDSLETSNEGMIFNVGGIESAKLAAEAHWQEKIKTCLIGV